MSGRPADRADATTEKTRKGPLALRIEDVRALERLAALKPCRGPRGRSSSWTTADRMTRPTPQAFLKTLEEPPAHTVIVLILSQLRALPGDRALPLPDRPLRARDRSRARGRPLPDGRERGLCAPRAPRSPKAEAGGAEAMLRVRRSARPRPARRRRRWSRRAGSAIATSSVAQAGGDPRSAVFETRAAAPRRARGLDEVLRGLAACREAWQALQGNVSPAHRRGAAGPLVGAADRGAGA